MDNIRALTEVFVSCVGDGDDLGQDDIARSITPLLMVAWCVAHSANISPETFSKIALLIAETDEEAA